MFLRVISVSIAGENSENIKGDSIADLAIHYKNGAEYNLNFYEINERYAAVENNGLMSPFYTNVRDVELIFDGIAQIKEGKTINPT